jgi:hypothetical protein
MWKLLIGFLLAILGPLVLEHFMRSLSEPIWRTLAFICVLAGLASVADSSFVKPFWSDYKQHNVLSTALVMAATSIITGVAWCLFFLGIPNSERTPADVERLISTWLDKSKMRYIKGKPPSDRHFGYVVFGQEGEPINITVHKTYGPYVLVESFLPMGDETKTRIKTLSPAGLQSFYTEFRAELLKQRMNSKFDIPLRIITVSNQVSFTDLTQETFLAAIARTNDESVFALMQVELCLSRAERIK